MIYLCFDLGLKNTGVAWADSTKLPQPLTTLHHRDIEHLLSQIKKTITKYNPDLVVFGKPSRGVIKDLSEELKKKLRDSYLGKIYIQDEDLSSQQAQKKIIQTGKSAIKRRRIHHSAAASIILQNFLDQH